eukprot:jgi/Chrzof1/4609/Cz14g19310.t1
MKLGEATDKFFKISERGSSIATEIRAGVITFLTMSYILLVNPQILAVAGLPIEYVVTATALCSSISSFMVGLLANLPVGMSPGMGLNAYFVYSQILGLGVSLNAGLAGCFMAACIVAVLAVVRALNVVLAVVPDSIKLATVVGMGLLLSFIGLQTAKIVVADPETMVKMGDITALEPMLAILGLAVIASLHYRNVKGAIIIGVLLTALGFFTFHGQWPHQFVAVPQLKVWQLDFTTLVKSPTVTAYSAVLAYALVMIFDIGGAMFGLGNLAGLVQNGTVPGAVWAYLSGAVGTALGAWTGTTPVIIAAESAVGIKEGGRTGLVAVTVSGCFLLSVFLAPALRAIPQVATAPVLVLVGAMMMGEAIHIDWSSMPSAVPAFLTMVIQPFTFSIANGIYAGLVMSLLLFLMTGEFITYFKNLLCGKEDENDFLEEPLLEDGHPPDEPPMLHPHPDRSEAMHTPASRAAAAAHRISEGIKMRSSYERKSFIMLSNTAGSHTAGSYLGGSFTENGGWHGYRHAGSAGTPDHGSLHGSP